MGDEKRGVWITFQYAPYEGCWQIVPHASPEEATRYLAGQHGSQPCIQFVPFGEELRP